MSAKVRTTADLREMAVILAEICNKAERMRSGPTMILNPVVVAQGRLLVGQSLYIERPGTLTKKGQRR